jgi:hypothetical protein
MRIVVQMASTPAGGEDVIGFLQDAAASSFNSSTIQQVQLLGQRTLYRCAGTQPLSTELVCFSCCLPCSHPYGLAPHCAVVYSSTPRVHRVQSQRNSPQ